MGATYFTGDLHLGHEKVAELRGFSTTDEHDEAVLDSLHRVLTKDTTLYLLGDISGGSTWAEDRALELLSDIPGTVHFIAGNHDSVASVHRNGWKRQRRFLEVFDTVRDFARIRLERQNVMLSHYPYLSQGDGPGRGEARYEEVRLPDVGNYLIHAHTHHTEIVNPDHPRQFCVSWDVGGPVHLKVISDKIRQGEE